MRPSEKSSDPGENFPQDNRLHHLEIIDSPTTGISRSSSWKSSLKISRVTDELNCKSTAPAMVPPPCKGRRGQMPICSPLLCMSLLPKPIDGYNCVWREGEREIDFFFFLIKRETLEWINWIWVKWNCNWLGFDEWF